MSGGVNIGGTVIGTQVIQEDSTMQLINQEDPAQYVSTYVERSAMRCLKEIGFIFIKGISGSGKSRLGLRLLAEMQTQTGRTPVVLTAPAQWDLIPKNQGKYTVLIDDIFGSSNLVQSQLDDWIRCFKIMLPSVESGCVFLVITSRSEISAHCENRLKNYKIINNILHIDEGAYQLKNREKIKILRKICGDSMFSKQNLVTISHFTTKLGFPQCCCFFASSIKAQNKGAAFFENPHEYILHEIKTMQESDGLGYLSLVLVLMKSDSLTGKDLTNSKSNMIERCQQYCRNLPQRITPADIKHKLGVLCGVYLSKQGNAYTFQHQSIYDAVFISISREWPNEFMNLCPSHVLLEFVRTSRSEEDTSDSVCYIEAEDYDILAEKITGLILSEDLNIINHPCMKEYAFVCNLVELWERQQCLTTIINKGVDLDFSKAELFGIENVNYSRECRYLGSIMVMKGQHTLVMSCVSKHKLSVKVLQDMLPCAIRVADSELARILLDMEASPSDLCLRALSASGDIADDITDRIFNHAITTRKQATTESCDNDAYQSETSSDQENEDQNVSSLSELLPNAVLNGNSHLVDLIVDNFDDYDICFGTFESYLRDIFEEMLYSTERQKYMTEKTISILKRLISLHGDFYDADYLMWLAAGHLDARILKVMLQMDVDIWATKERSEDLFHCLVYNPTDLLTYPYCSMWPTALEQAVTHGGLDCLHELLKYMEHQNTGIARSKSLNDPHESTNVDDMVESGVNRFLLHIASERRDVDKIGLLISAGMEVDHEDDEGNTPLHIAVQCDSLPCVQLLVKSHASVNARNNDEITPLLCIRRQKFTTMYIELKPNPRKKHTKHSNVEMVKYLVKSGCDVNHADKDGYTPLIVAVKSNDLDSVRVLVENSADVNYNNTSYSSFEETCSGTAVLVASLHSDVEIIKFLCEHGARLDIRDAHEETMLHKAAGSNIDPMEKLQYLTDVQNVFLHSVDRFGRTALFNAVESGDEEIVEYLLNKKMNVDHTDKADCSVLMHACQTSTSGVISLLSKRGANTFVQDRDGNTALHCVVHVGNTESTKFFLEMNADPRSRNINGKSSLHFAAQGNSSDIVKLLLDKGGDPCAPDNEGKTALQYALQRKDSECIKLLLQKGEDTCMQGKEGEMALYEETKKGNSECIKIIIEKGANAHVQDEEGKTLLHYAANSKDSIQTLVDKGVDPHITDNKGRTALHAAIGYFTDVDCISLLIDSGVDPNAKDVEGMTALHYAVDDCFKVACFKALVQKGADPYIQDKEGKTVVEYALCKVCHDTSMKQFLECIDPSVADHKGKTSLHYAATTEYIKTVESILGKTLDPCVQDKKNMTALHYAAKYSQAGNIALLLENGTDPSIQDQDGKTALHYAAEAFDCICVLFLLESDMDPLVQDNEGKTALHYSAKSNCGECTELLLEHMAHINTQDKVGKTALHYAAEISNLGSVQLILNNDIVKNSINQLLEKGGDPQTQDREGKTALHYAAAAGNDENINLLLETGADPQTQDKEGKTALHYAAAAAAAAAVGWGDIFPPMTESGCSDSIKLLLEKEVDMCVQDKLGKTALHYAAENGRRENIKLLLEKGFDPHAQDKQGKTPLHYAAKIHCSAGIFWTLQSDPEVKWGRTAFLQVAMKANCTIMKVLIKKRVFHNHYHDALGCVESDCIRLLLEKGNSTCVQDIKGRTALHYATEDSRNIRGTDDSIRLLLEKGSDPCLQEKEGTTALHFASASGMSNTVKILLDSGAFPCEQDIDDRTPLHYAAMTGDKESTKLLLEKGADPCVQDKDGMTALHFAAEILDSDCLELLLKSGAVPWRQDNMGRTALHYAAAVGKIENIQLLREKGADPFSQDSQGWTPLQYAQHTGFSETVEKLLNTGALAVQRSRLQLHDLGYYNPSERIKNPKVIMNSMSCLNYASNDPYK